MRLIRNKDSLLIIGNFSLLIMILLKMMPFQLPILDFFEGVFAGISIVTNISFLVYFGRKKESHAIKLNLIKNE